MRERSRLGHRGRRAAALLGVVLAVRPELERDGDGLAVLRAEERGDARVDAARHGHKRSGRVRSSGTGHRATRSDGRSQRTGERVGRDIRGVALCRAQAAELGCDRVGADAGGVEQRRAADERHGRGGRGVRCAAAVGAEAGVGDVGAVGLDAERHLVAALTAAEGDREGVDGGVALALGRGQVVLEGESVHVRTQDM